MVARARLQSVHSIAKVSHGPSFYGSGRDARRVTCKSIRSFTDFSTPQTHPLKVLMSDGEMCTFRSGLFQNKGSLVFELAPRSKACKGMVIQLYSRKMSALSACATEARNVLAAT